MYGSVCHLLHFVLYLFYFVFSTKHFPPSGAVGVATFHPGYLSFPRLTPAMPMARGRFLSHDFSLVLAPVLPSILTRARLAIVPFL